MARGTLVDIVDYTGTTVGVSTNCQMISTLCGLELRMPPEPPFCPNQSSCTVDASEHLSFDCGSDFAGDILVPSYNSSGLLHSSYEDYITWTYPNYTEQHRNFGLAVFQDTNLSIAYNLEGRAPIPQHNLPSPAYLGVAGLTYSQAGPEFVDKGFVLRCDVHTYDVTYSSTNGTVSPSSITAVQDNGTALFKLLGAMSTQQTRLAQILDVAGLQQQYI